jgi:single-stranded-DNA-specific exonuclease
MNIVCEEDNKIFKSIKNRKWQKFPVDLLRLKEFQNRADLPKILLEILSQKDISSNDIDRYLNPKLRDYLPDPYHLMDMEKAAKFLASAIKQNKKIAVFGDYDVDGATSSALIRNYFKSINSNVGIYIPDRIREGYGPNIEALTKLKSDGYEIIITVDCGVVAYEALCEAKKIGLEIVVIDHHIGGETLPEAIAVVNPNRTDEKSQYGYLCAAGIVFLLLIALNKELEKINHPACDVNKLLEFLDLVALATVCDVVPLKGLNRAFVSQGIKLIAKGSNIGIKALKQISNLGTDIDAYHLGFILGPRVNAGGRVGNANLGAELMSADDYNVALELARTLDIHNYERRAVELKLIEMAFKDVSMQPKNSPIAFVIGHEWHLGVIGIIAGRVKEKFNKPAIIIAVKDGIGKASCRSVRGIDIGKLIHKAKKEDLLIAGGGHAMAAGFTVAQDKIDELRIFFKKEIYSIYQKFIESDLEYYDSILTPSSIDIELINIISQVGPFGSENPQPRFFLKNVNVINAKLVGNEHISCMLTDSNVKTGNFVKAISFRVINSPMAEILLRNQKNVNLIVQLSINKWNDRISPEITIQDVIID